jgi:hypothetical protein
MSRQSGSVQTIVSLATLGALGLSVPTIGEADVGRLAAEYSPDTHRAAF